MSKDTLKELLQAWSEYLKEHDYDKHGLRIGSNYIKRVSFFEFMSWLSQREGK